MNTAVLAVEESERHPAQTRRVTLLDLVAALADSGTSEVEVVWAITDLVNSGRVRLVGQFREAHIPRFGSADYPGSLFASKKI